jgi:hypothetical protein
LRRARRGPTIATEMPTAGDEASTGEGGEEPGVAAVAATTGEAPSDEPPEEDPFPPALIRKLREPDRAVARIIGDMAPAEARLGAELTFGLSEAGRLAERAAVGGTTEQRARGNVLSLPHPRISPLPARGATVKALGEDDPEET